MGKRYRPRNDLVVVRTFSAGPVKGIHMPDQAEEGRRIQVVEIGPQVEDLEVGDLVLAVGTPGEDLVRIPGESSLYLTKQANVLCVVEKRED